MKNTIFTFLLSGFFVMNLSAQINTTIINQTTFGGDDQEFGSSIIVADSGIYFMGSTLSSHSGSLPYLSNGSVDIWLIKLNNQLQIEWQKLLGGSNVDAGSKIIDHKGALYLFSGSNSPISGTKTIPVYSGTDCWVIKMDYSGNEIWQKAYYPDTSAIHEFFSGSVKSIGDNIVFGGQTKSGIGGMKTDTCRGLNDAWILCIDTSGNVLWDKTIGGEKHDVAVSLNSSANDSIIFVSINSKTDILSGDLLIPSFDTSEVESDYVVFSLNANTGAIINQYRFGAFTMIS